MDTDTDPNAIRDVFNQLFIAPGMRSNTGRHAIQVSTSSQSIDFFAGLSIYLLELQGVIAKFILLLRHLYQ